MVVSDLIVEFVSQNKYPQRLRPNNPSCPRQIRQKEKTASIASLYAQSPEAPNTRRECKRKTVSLASVSSKKLKTEEETKPDVSHEMEELSLFMNFVDQTWFDTQVHEIL
ncbi:hypothetical protein LINPERPRIM_LOCUS34535, partial [Linum perenne]